MITKSLVRSGILRIASKEQADLLARIFYGIELPACESPNANRIQKIRVKALLHRGAISDEMKITPYGMKILAHYKWRVSIGKHGKS